MVHLSVGWGSSDDGQPPTSHRWFGGGKGMTGKHLPFPGWCSHLPLLKALYLPVAKVKEASRCEKSI